MVALAIILMQPLGAPWWYHADADGTYVANSYELAAGHHTWYLDHPGMPLQDLMAITFEARYVGQKLFGSATPKDQYLNQQVLNLDDSRPYFRSFAAVFYLLGALIAFWVVRATLKSTLWGIGAGLLWIGAPGLVEMSIQYRADVPLCALVLLVGFLIVRAAERRDAWLYVLATFALGFTITVKIHAAALVAPLALAVAVRPPLGPWRDALVIRTRNVAVRLRIPLALAASAWIVLIVIFNRSRLPSPFGDWRYPNGTHTNADIRRLVLEILVVLIGYTALALVARRIRSRIVRRLFDPFVAVLLWSLVVGVVLPGTLVIEDGLAMLVSIHDGLTGGGVNTSVYVTPFAHAWNNLVHWPLQQFLVLFGLAAVAVVVGVRRGELGPALWFTAAAAAALFAAARLGTRHYWAPAYVLSVPPALWLCRQLRLVGAVGAAGLVLYVFVPGARRRARRSRPSPPADAWASPVWNATADRLLKPAEIALAPPYVAPVEDVPYLDLVGLWVESPPQRTYRFVSAREQGLQVASVQRAKVAYYFGPLALGINRAETIELVPGHSYAVEPLLAERRPDVGLGVLR